MKIRLEQPTKGQLDHELVWLVVLTATAIVGVAWLLFPVPKPQCLFYMLTGVPCPTCGGTRCARNLLSGDFTAAFLWNPLIFLLVIAMAIYGIYASATTLLRLPRIRVYSLSRVERHLLQIGSAFAIGANWIYLIHRFSHSI